MIVADFMIPRSKVVACAETSSIKEVLDLMIEKKVGAVVVVDYIDECYRNNEVVGIVSKSDFIKAFDLEKSLDTKIGRIMSQMVLYVGKNASIDEAASMLEDQGIHHALVTDEEGGFLGIFSSLDLALAGRHEKKRLAISSKPSPLKGPVAEDAEDSLEHIRELLYMKFVDG